MFLVDRFLQKIAVREGQLQALGMAGMMIAVKFEEARKQPSDDSPHPFEVKDLIRSGGFSADKSKLNELLSTEAWMFSVLDFAISQPTPAHFLRCLPLSQCKTLQQQELMRPQNSMAKSTSA